jgi:pimeloyl-ACP methyl ester carboxylesterase
MQRLGYTRYVAQGGDWGAVVTEAMGRQAPRGLAGIHVNYPATVPPEVEAALAVGGPAPAELSEQERAVFDALESSAKKGGRAYFGMMTARPQALGYGQADSPPASPRGCSCTEASHGGPTAPTPGSPRRKMRCWMTSRCTG